jgi:Arc/MetJ-type ribon-helix-helix transcriptional regulator
MEVNEHPPSGSPIVVVRLPASLIAAITDYQRGRFLASRSEAVRQLLLERLADGRPPA